MKELAKRVWEEPAVAIGLLTSILLAVLNLVTDNDWNAEHIIAIAAPLLSALGIRPLVTPTRKVEELSEVSMKTPAQPLP